MRSRQHYFWLASRDRVSGWKIAVPGTETPRVSLDAPHRSPRTPSVEGAGGGWPDVESEPDENSTTSVSEESSPGSYHRTRKGNTCPPGCWELKRLPWAILKFPIQLEFCIRGVGPCPHMSLDPRLVTCGPHHIHLVFHGSPTLHVQHLPLEYA